MASSGKMAARCGVLLAMYVTSTVSAKHPISPPKDFRYAPLTPTHVLIGWSAPQLSAGWDRIHYDVTLCHTAATTNCQQVTANSSCRLDLHELLAANDYSVSIVAVQSTDRSAPLNATFTTLTKDWPTPTNITLRPASDKYLSVNASKIAVDILWSLEAEEEEEDEMVKRPTHDLEQHHEAGDSGQQFGQEEAANQTHGSWPTQPPEQRAVFFVTLCSLQHGRPPNCTSYSAGAEHELRVEVNFFENVTLTVAAVYSLPLSQHVTQRRTVNRQTPGTRPLAVGMPRVFNVTSSSADLDWQRPANVPATVSLRYALTDVTRTVNVTTTHEHATLAAGLRAYSEYNVSIVASACYGGATYVGVPAALVFATDVAAPDPPATLTAEQQSHSDRVRVRWTPPPAEGRRGPLDYYTLTVSQTNENRTLLQRNVSKAAEQEELTFPLADEETTNYTIGVAAVNIDRARRALVSQQVQTHLQLALPDSPTAIRLLNRTANSLALDIISAAATNVSFSSPSSSSSGTTTSTQTPGVPFYLVSWPPAGSLRSAEARLVVAPLSAYTNVTLSVRRCYNARLCSRPPLQQAFLTNVAAPSLPTSVRVVAFNRTNPAVSWQAPREPGGPLAGYRLQLVNLLAPNATRRVTLHPNRTEYTFNTTDEYETYAITVAAFNVDLDNATHTFESQTANATLRTTGFSAPKPDDLHVSSFNATTISVRWTRPSPNGNLSAAWYYVEMRTACSASDAAATSGDRCIDVADGGLTPRTGFEWAGLHAFADVVLSVRGCTTNTTSSCGQPRTLHTRTDVAAPSRTRSLLAAKTNESAALLTWAPPDVRNGPIDGYFVDIISLDRNASASHHDVLGNNCSLQLSGLAAHVHYNASVIAYNTDQFGARLLSPAVTISFETTDTARGTAIALGVLLSLAGCTLVATVAFFVGQRKRSQSDDHQRLIFG